jgi:hypothetical protein
MVTFQTPAPSADHAALAIVNRFLMLLGDPEGGDALLRLHTGDAALVHEGGLIRAAAADPHGFAATHRETNLRYRDILPVFEQAELLRRCEDSETGEVVAWFEVTEIRQQRRLPLAVGLRERLGEGCVGWCVVASGIEEWTYCHGLLQSLADYPWVRRDEPARARALLDASYFRQFHRSRVSFQTLPDTRFSCRMSTACCRHDFEIVLPVEAQMIIDAVPWTTLRPQLQGTRLPLRADGKLQLKALNETCRFLGTQQQCLIHQTLGRQPFGPCAIFPYAFAHTPEGIAVALSPICGSTRMGFGVEPHEREDDLLERLMHAEPRRTDAFRLAPGFEVSWSDFRDIERALCQCLGSADLPMRRRLHVGARLLGAIRQRQAVETQRWIIEPLADVATELREAIRGMLAKILQWDRAALRALPQVLPQDLSRLEVQEPAVVVRILQNTLYSKIYSYPLDLTTAFNLVIVLYLLTLVMQHAAAGPLSETMWRELGSLGVHGLLRNILHDGVPEGFRLLFGSSDFGLWALAA